MFGPSRPIHSLDQMKPRTVYEKAVRDFTETAQQLARLDQQFRQASFAIAHCRASNQRLIALGTAEFRLERAGSRNADTGFAPSSGACSFAKSGLAGQLPVRRN